jgi:signal transduction histidine kinase
MKREFVSAVSHELRTPLTAIRGSLEMLADGDVGELPGSARPIVEMATRGSERLSRLVDVDEPRQQSGAGLGLTITQRIVEAHGGTIWARSEPGHGSSFHFTLPLPNPTADQPSRGDEHDPHEVAETQRRSQLTGP